MAEETATGPVRKVMQELPTDLVTNELRGIATALAERALSSVSDKIESMAGRLTEYADGGGTSLMAAITGSENTGGSRISQAFGGVKDTLGGLGKLGGGLAKLRGLGKKGSQQPKMTNIVEEIAVGAPVRVVYNQWTQLEEFPKYMKKVEKVEQEADEKVSWKAQIFWSHRTWQSEIIEQIPDERIIWRSHGAKGSVDGAVTFHELTPDYTRVMLVLEYHPQGVVERVGNMWRAPGRRARLELKHFARQVMTQTMLHPDQMTADGWRGEIHDGRVVKDHEAALEEEQAREPEEAEEAEFEEEEPEAELEEEAEEEPEEAEEEAEAEEEEEPEAEEEAEAEEEEPEEEPEEAEARERRGRPPRERKREPEQEPEQERAAAQGRTTREGKAPVRRRRFEEEEEEPSRPSARRTGVRRG